MRRGIGAHAVRARRDPLLPSSHVETRVTEMRDIQPMPVDIDRLVVTASPCLESRISRPRTSGGSFADGPAAITAFAEPSDSMKHVTTIATRWER